MPQLPTDFSTQVASSSTSMLDQLAPFAEIVLGVLLAAVVLRLILSFFNHH